MILIEKDRHIKRQSPFFQAHIKLNDWYLSSELNTDTNYFISLGDWYNTAIPSPEEIDETERFFSLSKFKEIFLLAGNHDWSETLKTRSILPLRNNQRITIITKPCVKTIEGKTFAFLPHLQRGMRETYTNLSEEFVNADYCLYHFEDETIKFGKNKTGIDISYLKGKRIGGHIHTQQKNYELGMPVISNYTERNSENNIMCISDKEEFITLPKFIDYFDLEYGEEKPSTGIEFPIFDIYNAPSRKQAEKLYKDTYVHAIYEADKKDKEIQCVEHHDSITDFFNRYILDRSDIKEWALTRLKTIVEEK